MTNTFLDAIQKRRSYYGIDKSIAVSRERILEIVERAVRDVPSAFNSQSARAVVLLGEHHDGLWGIVMDALRKIVPPANFSKTQEKILSFAAGAGTVLYFDDTSIVAGLQEKFPSYAVNFPIWAQQANGMLQFAIWTALETEGLGASLQHYNPLIDAAVRARWQLPDTWQLIAQMPFGNPTAQPEEKEFAPIRERVKAFQ
jgi:predicted oxidoreductase (fatty acid repression mutant protein)